MMRQRMTGMLLGLAALASPCAEALEVGPVQLHGYLSQGYLHSGKINYIADSRAGTFDFREYGLNATVMPARRLTLGLQVFGREYGQVGNDKIFLDWAQADYLLRDWLSVRAGKLRVPYGLYGETRDIDALRTEILLPQAVYPEYMRESFDSGYALEIHGHIPAGRLGSASYAVQGGVRSRAAQDGDMARLLAERSLTVEEIEERGAAVAALTWHAPLAGTRLRGTLSWDRHDLSGLAETPAGAVPYEARTEDQILHIGSAEFARGALIVTGEYALTSFESDFHYHGGSSLGMRMTGKLWGGYLKASYQMTGRLAVGLGHSHSRTQNTFHWRGPGRAGTDVSDQHQKDSFVSLRLDLSEAVVLKGEQHWAHGVSGIFESENPDGTRDEWTLTMVKLSYLF